MFSMFFVVGGGEEDVGNGLKHSNDIRISGLAYDVVKRQGRLSELGDDFIRLRDGTENAAATCSGESGFYLSYVKEH
jgi:hypothetical protein